MRLKITARKIMAFVVCMGFVPIVLTLRCLGGIMDLKISLSIETPKRPIRQTKGVPVFPMGKAILLAAQFKNDGSNVMSLQDPKTSQHTLLYILPQATGEEIVILLNPSLMDSTGEITAPVSEDIQLDPQKSLTVPIELYKCCIDYVFRQGNYEVYVEYQNIKSEKLSFYVAFCSESVPRLIAIALDEAAELWMREEAVNWLDKMPVKVEINLPATEESTAKKAEREKTNREKADEFLQNWPGRMNSDAMVNFFNSVKLE